MNALISLLRMKETFDFPVLQALTVFSQEAEKFLSFKKSERLPASIFPSYEDMNFLLF